MISLGIGAYLIIVAGAEDANKNLILINKSAKNKQNPPKMLKKLNDYVQFHSNLKQLSNSTMFF